jgi:hypothetical protein
MPQDPEIPTPRSDELSFGQTLDTFKFYEDAAEKAKSHAWSQTTWILTLNAAIIGFSLTFYAEHGADPAFLLVEFISAAVGVVLCAFLIYLLQELGGHITHYWHTSNQLAAKHTQLVPFIGKDEAEKARKNNYTVAFPPFCRRLQILAALFAASHIMWVAVAAIYLQKIH